MGTAGRERDSPDRGQPGRTRGWPSLRAHTFFVSSRSLAVAPLARGAGPRAGSGPASYARFRNRQAARPCAPNECVRRQRRGRGRFVRFPGMPRLEDEGRGPCPIGTARHLNEANRHREMKQTSACCTYRVRAHLTSPRPPPAAAAAWISRSRGQLRTCNAPMIRGPSE